MRDTITWREKEYDFVRLPGFARSSFWLEEYENENEDVRMVTVLAWNKGRDILTLVSAKVHNLKK